MMLKDIQLNHLYKVNDQFLGNMIVKIIKCNKPDDYWNFEAIIILCESYKREIGTIRSFSYTEVIEEL